jgi:hypothetical protein
LPAVAGTTFFPPDQSTEEIMAEPVVGVVMGSDSDWETMQHAARRLEELGVPFECRVVSAHRTPDLLFRYAEEAPGRGIRCIIAGAGGAAHLPGMLAAKTALPVFGVPVPSKHLQEHRERDDQEGDHCVEEETVVDGDRTRRLRFRERSDGTVSITWISDKKIIAMRAPTLTDLERALIAHFLSVFPSKLSK